MQDAAVQASATEPGGNRYESLLEYEETDSEDGDPEGEQEE